MHTVTVFPLGNADCCRLDLAGGQKILVDYANTRNADDPSDRRVDLEKELRADLKAAKRDSFDVVAFTHLDTDHFCGSSEFFELRHAAKYQGKDRIKITEMWVPAAAIYEDRSDLAEEGRVIQAEARHRLKQGEGIRVFSRPAKLEAWLNAQGLTLQSRMHLITDAGQLVPGFSRSEQGVEFFVHSPFASRQDDGTFVDRNTCSLVMQAVFEVLGRETKVILAADTTHDVWTEIVRITKFHKRPERLEWDVFKLPHHCSYLSLGPEKGKEKTQPVDAVRWIMEEQDQLGATLVSTSDPIPTEDTDLPPHRQAAKYYRDNRGARGGTFVVTMEHPKVSAPEPLVITIDHRKATIRKRATAASVAVTSVVAPRAGAGRRRS
ncbi:MAG: hypothetical protein R2752_13105 [Vicinamibacterales bacterium]